MCYNPQESLENTINTMGTLVAVHPIVPWKTIKNIIWFKCATLPQSFYLVALIRLDATWVFIESYRPPLMSWWNARCGTDGTVHMTGVDRWTCLSPSDRTQDAGLGATQDLRTLGIPEFQFFFSKESMTKMSARQLVVSTIYRLQGFVVNFTLLVHNLLDPLFRILGYWSSCC